MESAAAYNGVEVMLGTQVTHANYNADGRFKVSYTRRNVHEDIDVTCNEITCDSIVLATGSSRYD